MKKNKTKIKFLILDVDGTLTDGKIYIGNDGESFKAFDIKDGYGIHDILPILGIVPIIITGRESEIVKRRCNELSIVHVYQGITDKLSKLNEILEKFSYQDNTGYGYQNCAYIGDDILDLECMKMIKDAGGWTAAPADAISEVKAFVDYVTETSAGNGAVRECIQFLKGMMETQNLEERIHGAVEYIRQLDKNNLKPGKYEITDKFYINVEEYFTKDLEECRFESHKKYVDIQWIVMGIEQIDTIEVDGLDIEIPYNKENDVVFFKDTEKNIMHTILPKDGYMILYPNNAHRPCINVHEKTKIKKIVGKVRV